MAATDATAVAFAPFTAIPHPAGRRCSVLHRRRASGLLCSLPPKVLDPSQRSGKRPPKSPEPHPGRRSAQETRGHGARGGRHRRWSASVEPAPGQARAAGDLGLDDAGDERTGALPQDPSRTDRDRMPRDRELRGRDHRVPKDPPHSSRRPANPPSSWLGPMVEIAWSISRSPPRMRPSPDRLPGSVELDDLVRIIDDNRDQGLEVVVPAGLGRRRR